VGSLANADMASLDAEARQLTVDFVDLVGSTPMSERIDPEEFFCGDPSPFGYLRREDSPLWRPHRQDDRGRTAVPQAHENDPERAVCASLAIAAAIKQRKFRVAWEPGRWVNGSAT
jgi:hypothetical protein